VDVIAGEVENAILIPVEALRKIDTDDYAVFVMENSLPRLRVVEVALQDYTTAAITSGLDAGDVVSTGLVETE
jgi:multidrug efflux pump subunit AcrA (membrane-fusion protein)